MKIQEVSQLTGRAAGLLANMVQNAPLLQFAEFRNDPSYFVNVPDKASFTSSAARAENAAPTKDNQTPNPTGQSLYMYGREAAIDDVRKLDSRLTGSNQGLQLYADRTLNSLAVKLAMEVQDDMIAGTNASYRMLGMSYFVKDAASGGQTAALGFTTTEQAAMNENVSLKIDNADDQAAFLEVLDKAIGYVPGANAIIVNSNLGSRLNSIARQKQLFGQGFSAFGTPVNTYNNVPIVTVPTTTILQTESDGTNSDCTSAYIVRFAEEQGVCFATNSGFYFQDFPDYESKAQQVARIQMFLALVVERTDAIRRLSRIRL